MVAVSFCFVYISHVDLASARLQKVWATGNDIIATWPWPPQPFVYISRLATIAITDKGAMCTGAADADRW